jgi:competence protein ComEC
MKFIAASIIIINFFFFSTFDNDEILSEDKLSVVIIDVGQGDAILLKFPKGTTALIDAGDVTRSYDNGERVILPLLEYLGIEKIDYAFVSHIDADHYAGFVSLVHLGVIRKIYKPSIDTSLTKDIKFEKYLSEMKIPVEYYKKEKLMIDDVPLFILNDDDIMNNYNFGSNDRSGVFKLIYGNTSFLFTGDIEKKAEKIYAEKYNSFLDSDLLKTGHHGSKTSSTETFLNYVTPELSIISAGIENKFNHPSPEVLDRLENFGSEIYRTDKQGALIFESDGETINFIDWKRY